MTPEESKNRRNIRNAQKRIEAEYEKAINDIFRAATNLKFAGDTFRLEDNPALNRKIREALSKFRVNVEAAIVNGIGLGFDLSQENFIKEVFTAYDGRSILPQVKEIINAKYERQMRAFLDRSINGLKLSDRVWNLANQLQREIEYTVFTGLSDGRSAQQMSRDIRGYLKNPDKLFRRVRNAEGRLVLSKPAKAFKPGQGVYRSSYKNAMRTARTEINTAYRSADHDRYRDTPFVLGVEIRLSEAHPEYDMCDLLVGVYPAWFKFTGWHIQCICYTVPVLPSKEEFDRYQQAVLDGKDKDFVFKGKVTEVPKKAFDWVKDNKDRIKKWKTPPLFMVDNREVFGVK